MQDVTVTTPEPKPICRRCGRLVDHSFSTPIIEQEMAIGRKIVYTCHGESMELPVRNDWFEDPDNKNKPFELAVFEPLKEQSARGQVSQTQGIRDDTISKIRANRVFCRSFVEDTIRTVMTNQFSAIYMESCGGFMDFCMLHDIHLRADYADFSGKDCEKQRLFVDGNEFGVFTIPMFFDAGKPEWVATKQP